MYSIRVLEGEIEKLKKLLAGIADVPKRLEHRKQTDPAEFAKTMLLREQTHHKGIISALGHHFF